MTTEFISIGPYCKTADFLKITKNRTFAYPFDWTFSSLFIISDCINDEFKSILNNDYIKFINYVQFSYIICDKILHLRLDGVSPVVINHHNLKNEETYKCI